MWRAWSDGSCVHAGAFGRGSGAWAAVVEHNHDGWVLRGREQHVTSSRMELAGALAALEFVPAGEPVTLRVDCTLMLSVRDAWQRAGAGKRVDWKRRRDWDLWLRLVKRMDVCPVTVELVGKGERDLVHQRCHLIAGAEARAQHQGVPSPSLQRRELRDRRLDRRHLFASETPSTI